MKLTINTKGEWTYFTFEDGSQIRKNGYKHFYRPNTKSKWQPYNNDSYYSCEEARRKSRSTSEESNIWWSTQNVLNALESLIENKKPNPKHALIAKKQKLEDLQKSLLWTHDEKQQEKIMKAIQQLKNEINTTS